MPKASRRDTSASVEILFVSSIHFFKYNFQAWRDYPSRVDCYLGICRVVSEPSAPHLRGSPELSLSPYLEFVRFQKAQGTTVLWGLCWVVISLIKANPLLFVSEQQPWCWLLAQTLQRWGEISQEWKDPMLGLKQMCGLLSMQIPETLTSHSK